MRRVPEEGESDRPLQRSGSSKGGEKAWHVGEAGLPLPGISRLLSAEKAVRPATGARTKTGLRARIPGKILRPASPCWCDRGSNPDPGRQLHRYTSRMHSPADRRTTPDRLPSGFCLSSHPRSIRDRSLGLYPCRAIRTHPEVPGAVCGSSLRPTACSSCDAGSTPLVRWERGRCASRHQNASSGTSIPCRIAAIPCSTADFIT